MSSSKVRVCVHEYPPWNSDLNFLSLEIPTQGSSRNRAKVLKLLSEEEECNDPNLYETNFNRTPSKFSQIDCDDCGYSDSDC